MVKGKPMTGNIAKAMVKWLGEENIPATGSCDGLCTPSILWHVCERLEREGWCFEFEDGKFEAYNVTHWFNAPTKADAVIAAWTREQEAKR